MPDQFYTQLPVNTMPLGSLLVKSELFYDMPVDWHVVITDIKNSTKAVLSGSHQDVNLIATGSIISVLNIAFGAHIEVPFFFGGDGATFIVPPLLINRVMRALALYKKNTLDNFGLEIRTGTIPVQEIYTNGCAIKIAKFNSAPGFSIPVVLGNGLSYAEQLIKGDDYLLAEHPPQEEELDLTGMQCRWDRIAPPKYKEEVVTLLVVACDSNRQAPVFQTVMNKMDELYGPPSNRQPISIARLKFKTTFGLVTEMRVRLGRIKILALCKNWIVNLCALVYFRTHKGKTYLERLVEMSDTLVLDGKINTVISGTTKQRSDLQAFFNDLERSGEIVYGLHVSNASVMSCYVRDLQDDHIHFVDGSEGGYTQAARQIKAKLKK